jgi:hypothetical protein
MDNGKELLEELGRKVDRLASDLERAKISEYVNLMEDTKRLLLINLAVGLARGLGIAIGFSLLGAIAIYFLRRLVMLNLPLIGDFIAEIIKLVNRSM